MKFGEMPGQDGWINLDKVNMIRVDSSPSGEQWVVRLFMGNDFSPISVSFPTQTAARRWARKLIRVRDE